MTLLPHARHDGSNFASMKRPTLAVSAAILGGAIALRTLVAWAPVLRFDVDPVFDPAPFAGLGPAGSLYIDAVIALSAAFILAECASSWALTLLLVAGLASISIFQIHGVGAAGTPWRGATWIAGFVAAAAAVSLARSPQNTAKIAWSVLVTCLIAVAGAWWMRGAWQWCVEQPAVVEFFHSGARDVAFLPSMVGTPMARKRRRMCGDFRSGKCRAGLAWRIFSPDFSRPSLWRALLLARGCHGVIKSTRSLSRYCAQSFRWPMVPRERLSPCCLGLRFL